MDSVAVRPTPAPTAQTRTVAAVGVLAAASFLLMLLEVPLPGLEYLKYDPSDAAALVGGFTLGPKAGALVVVIRNLLRAGLVKFDPVGLSMNTLAGVSLTVTAAAWYQARLTRTAAAVGLCLGVLVQTTVCAAAAFVVFPLYGLPVDGTVVATVVVPFNLGKAGLTSLLTFLLYKRLAARLPRLRSPDPGTPAP